MSSLALSAARYHYNKETVAEFLQAKCDFTRKMAVLRFELLLGDLRAGQRTMIILGSLESAYGTSY